jgi:hypothetical protein
LTSVRPGAWTTIVWISEIGGSDHAIHPSQGLTEFSRFGFTKGLVGKDLYLLRAKPVKEMLDDIQTGPIDDRQAWFSHDLATTV